MRSASALEALFYGGAHKDVLLATIDGTSGDFDDADTFLVIGALVFSGRTDEAVSIFRTWERASADPARRDPEQAAACRFFLCIAECRAGRYVAAEKLCRATLGELSLPGSARARFYFHQGVGLVRHFTGRMGSASRHASRARRHALEARFPYGRMLALDLMGHALLHRGKVLSGLALLEQAAELAEGIGLESLARTTRSAIVANRARFGVGEESPTEELLRHLDRNGDADRYSKRVLLTELAEAHAFRGDAASAARELRRAEEVALPDGDRRATVKLLLARSLVVGLSQGEEAAARVLAEVEALVDPAMDPALAVEITWYEFLVCPARFARRPTEQLVRAARATGIARAVLLANTREAGLHLRAGEDRFATLVIAVRRAERGLDEVLAHDLLGLLPMSLGCSPGQRIHLDPERRFFAIEQHGNVVRAEVPSDAVVSLLRALACGPRSKEDLIREVWQLNVYRPEKHDAVVHTAVSRLRSALGSHAGWIQVSGVGYRIAQGVEVRENAERARGAAPITPSELPPALDPRRTAVLELVQREGGAATRDVVERLKISEMTALRLLTLLVDEGVIERIGRGRNTRYTPAS